MKCAVCGARLPENAVSCPECGSETVSDLTRDPGTVLPDLMSSLAPAAMSRWSLIGWVIVGVAAVYYLAYSFRLLPFAIYRVPSLYPVASPLFSPALILAMVLVIIGIVILAAKFITGVRDRDARRVLGVAVGWALLIGIPFTYTGPWMLLAAAGLAGIAALIHFTNQSR